MSDPPWHPSRSAANSFYSVPFLPSPSMSVLLHLMLSLILILGHPLFLFPSTIPINKSFLIPVLLATWPINVNFLLFTMFNRMCVNAEYRDEKKIQAFELWCYQDTDFENKLVKEKN